MSSPADKPADSLDGSPDDRRMGELINEFFDRRQRGEDLSHEVFLAEHPEYADELREHLRGLDLIPGLGSKSTWQVPPKDPGPGAAGSSGEDTLGSSAPVLPEIPGYDVLKEIGRGGMGLVYKATQRSTRRVVALKLLLEGPLASETARRRFEREVSLAAQLRHPNIIPIYDSGVIQGRMYYAMEHVYGTALCDHLKAHALSIPAKLKLFAKICRAVSHAHQRGVIHRDLKPTNILVDVNHEPHVLDFGLAKAGTLGDMSISMTAQIIGTPAYMSPEQAAGDPRGVDVRSDVYSLGMILFEMLTGRMPYETNAPIGKVLNNIAQAEPSPPSKINPKIDSELSAIVLKALEKSKEDRYQSVDAFLGDIERYLAGEPISARPASSLYLLRKAILKHRLAAGVSALLFVVAGIAFGAVRYYSAKLAEEADSLRHKQAEVVRQMEKLTRDAEVLTRQRNEAEASRAAYDGLLRNIDPNLARQIDPLARQFAAGVARGEAPRDLVARLLLAGMTELGEELVEPSEDEPPAMSTKADMPGRLAKEDFSRVFVEGDPSGEESGRTLLSPEVVDALLTLAGWKQLTTPAPAQPHPAATSQPSSRPADLTSSSATTKQSESASSPKQ